MSKQYIDSILFADGLPVAHAGPGGHACAKEECWVVVGPQKVKQNFTNIVHAKDLKATSTRVFVQGHPVATLASFASQSYGDESAESGVKSGTTLGPARFQTGSSSYFLEGSPVVRQGDVIISNEGNTEPTTWNQPGSAREAMAQIKSDPLEVLAKPAALNIQLIRSPAESLKPASIQQFLSVKHQGTGHQTHSSYGAFKNHENTFLWHQDKLREGLYQVNEFYPHCGKIMTVPLGKIHSTATNDKTPGMKLVPLAFRRYDDMQHSVEGSKPPNPQTYIYLFKDKYLWRIFYVNQHGNIDEKDLSSARKNIRDESSAQIKQGVLLPIEDAEGKHEFYLTVSKLPLSWDTLHQLGGLHPEDPRFEAKDRLPITPDPEFIQQRLQHIDIHALIAQGEMRSSIPLKSTEDELLRARHENEPPHSNWEWVVDRDRFKPSKGTTAAPKDLYWHVEAPNTHAPTLQNLSALKLAPKIVPGAAVLLIHDPLSRLMITAEELIYQEAHFGAYASENGELYELSILIGQVLDSVKDDKKDHVKHIDNAARLKFIESFDKKRESYLAFMKEGVRKLIYWFEKSHELGQWEDFNRVPPNPDATKEAAWELHRLRKNIYAAFLLDPDGIAYLRDDVQRANGYVLESIKLVQKLSKFEAIPRMVNEAASLMAMTLKPGTESLNKIKSLIEDCMRIKISVRLVSHSLDELMEYHQRLLIRQKTQHTDMVKIRMGMVNRFPVIAIKSASGKLIQVVYIDEVPAFEWFKVVPGTNSSVVPDRLAAVNSFATKVNNVPAFRLTVSAFSIFNALSIAEQIKEMGAMGDLNEGTSAVLHAEMIRNAMVAGHLAFEAGLMTRGIAKREWAGKATTYASGMNFILCLVGVLIDGLFIVKSMYFGEYKLSIAHMVSLSSNMLMMNILKKNFKNKAISKPRYAIAVALCILSAYLIHRFTKSSLENWFYMGYWGNATNGKDYPSHSIEKFHMIMTFVNLEEIEALDQNGQRRPRSLSEEEHPGWIDPLWMVKNTTETLRFKLTTTDEIENRCEISVYAQSPGGLYLLKHEHLFHEPATKSDVGITWAFRIPRKYFAKNGIIGEIYLASYDPESGALLGKDAYEITCNDLYDTYSCKKVMYEP